MTASIDQTRSDLRAQPKRWLITGVAGFIGSNLAQELLELGQEVVGLDNFATGRQVNLDQLQAEVGAEAWGRFRFVEGSIIDMATCAEAAPASTTSSTRAPWARCRARWPIRCRPTTPLSPGT